MLVFHSNHDFGHSNVSQLRRQLDWRLGAAAAFALSVLTCMLVAVFALKLAGLWLAWRALTADTFHLAAGWGIVALTAGALSVLFFRLLWIPAPPPEGILLPRRAADAFHRLIDKMERRFGAVAIAGVWISDTMNAAVVQRARWGCVGPMETHLVIGLPLTHSLSRQQLAAVLAHEFAHVALQRRGMGAWLAHFRAWWLRVLERTCTLLPFMAPALDALFARFYRGMVTLARLEEFEADAMAARLVGADLLGQTLIEVTLKERFLSEDYWPKVLAQSNSRPRPSIRPYREMGLGVAAGFLRASAVRLAATSLVESRDGGASFHPTLTERLRALQVPLQAAKRDQPSAASHYLAPLLPSLAWVFDRAWWRDTRRVWRRQHRSNVPRGYGRQKSVPSQESEQGGPFDVPSDF